MSREANETRVHGDGGGCCGGRAQVQTLEQMERELEALWVRVQQERARRLETEPVKKSGCCCG